jgi:hypothetical protein
MATVTKVRRELSSDGTHRHLEGVCTADGTHYTRRQVVDGINRGEDWHTSGGGQDRQDQADDVLSQDELLRDALHHNGARSHHREQSGEASGLLSAARSHPSTLRVVPLNLHGVTFSFHFCMVANATFGERCKIVPRAKWAPLSCRHPSACSGTLDSALGYRGGGNPGIAICRYNVPASRGRGLLVPGRRQAGGESRIFRPAV